MIFNGFVAELLATLFGTFLIVASVCSGVQEWTDSDPEGTSNLMMRS